MSKLRGNRLAVQSTCTRYRDPYYVRHSSACRMLDAGMKATHCAKILGAFYTGVFDDLRALH